jgi:hypothetical protein
MPFVRDASRVVKNGPKRHFVGEGVNLSRDHDLDLGRIRWLRSEQPLFNGVLDLHMDVETL